MGKAGRDKSWISIYWFLENMKWQFLNLEYRINIYQQTWDVNLVIWDQRLSKTWNRNLVIWDQQPQQRRKWNFGKLQFKALTIDFLFSIKGIVLQLKAHRYLKLMSIFNERSPPPLNINMCRLFLFSIKGIKSCALRD